MVRDSGNHSAPVLVTHADLLVGAFSLYGACWIRDTILARVSTLWGGETDLLPRYPLLLLGTLPILIGSLYLCGAYESPRFKSVLEYASSVGKSFVIATVSVMAFAFLLRDQLFSRVIILGYLILSHLGFVVVRAVVVALQARRGQRVGPERVLIVGTGPGAQAISQFLRRRTGFEVLGFVDVPFERERDATAESVGEVEDLQLLADRLVVDTVVFGLSLEESARLDRLIWKLEEVGLTVHLRGDALGALLSRTSIGVIEGMPILTLASTPSNSLALGVKRGLDFAGGLLGLVVLAPVLAAAGVLVKVSSPGPILHCQERLGLNGRRFRMLKFRSMHVDAERRLAEVAAQNEMTGPVFKMRDDPRVTAVGRWLRRFSIDELPQLWNVLRGDMSLVGPRPPLPDEVDRYKRWQRRRLSMKPGLTCLWQVNGRNDLDFDTWMRLDMQYIDQWSLALDVKILLKTVPVVLMARGAR